MSNAVSPRMHSLLHAPIPGMLWKLAAPNVVAVVMMTAVTFADAWFVGRLGIAALASLALVFPFQTLMQMMAAGAIGGGVTSALARALGRGDDAGADAVAWHALIVAGAMAVLYMTLLGFLARPIFAAMGGTGDALDGAVRYARIVFGGAAIPWLLYALSAILRGTGDTATPARAVIASSVAQVVASGALTLGWGPVPAMGIAGPATAMVGCQGLATLYLVSHLMRGHAGVRLSTRRFRWQPVASIMQVGGIGLVNSLTIVMTVVTVTGLVGRFGTQALAGYGLGSRLELMLVPIAFGIGAALTAAVGINFGAGQYARARRIAWTGAGATFVVTGAIGITATLMPDLWLDRFTTDPAARSYGTLYLAIAAPFYGLFGAGQTLYFASQGTGRMLLPVLVGVIRLLVVAGFGALAVMFSWEIGAVFAAVSAGLAVVGVGLGLCMISPGWRPDLRV